MGVNVAYDDGYAAGYRSYTAWSGPAGWTNPYPTGTYNAAQWEAGYTAGLAEATRRSK